MKNTKMGISNATPKARNSCVVVEKASRMVQF